MHALGMDYILVNTNLKLNDFTRRLRTPSCFMGAIIGPASDVKRPIFTIFCRRSRCNRSGADNFEYTIRSHYTYTCAIVSIMKLMYIIIKKNIHENVHISGDNRPVTSIGMWTGVV